MAKKTAVITGALGQDGRLLAGRLLGAGYRVIGLVRPGRTPPNGEQLASVHFDTIDLADSAAALTMLQKWQPDELYHLAAVHHASEESAAGSALAVKEAMVATNFLSTKALAFALVQLQLPCHIVFAASSQMFTAEGGRHEISEASPRRPSTFYGHTKAWSADLLAFLRAQSGLRASIAILFNHESPLRDPRFVSRKITRAAAGAGTGRTPKLELDNIGARVDWCSAHDVARALHLMAAAKDSREYVVASGELHSVRDLLASAFQHVGCDWRDYVSFRDDRECPALVGQAQRLRETFGWHPALSFDQMVGEMVDRDIALSEASADRQH